MARTPEMQRTLDELFPLQAARRELGLCATCGRSVGEFRDALSRKEFSISGMCQVCQDEVFGEGMGETLDDYHS